MTGTIWYATFVIPRETSEDSFDFYITDEEFIQNNVYQFFTIYDFLGWSYMSKPCSSYLTIRCRKDVCGKTSLLKSDTTSVVCTKDNWPQSVIVSSSLNPNLMLVVGCRALNLSHYDLAGWVFLEYKEYEERFNKNTDLYKNLTANFFSKANGLGDIHFQQLILILGVNLYDKNIDKLTTSLCPSNACPVKANSHTSKKSVEYLYFFMGYLCTYFWNYSNLANKIHVTK